MIIQPTLPNLIKRSDLSEYLVLINPSDAVKTEVGEMKRKFFREHGTYEGQNSSAHVSLMSFFQLEDREDKLVYAACEAMKQCQEFDVFLNGFGFFPSNNTFFIDILDKQPIIHLYHQLRIQLFRQLVSLSFLRNGFLPHMTIGRAVSSMQYLNALREYDGKAYTNNFRVFYLTILKRKAPFRVWDKLIDIPLGNPVQELW